MERAKGNVTGTPVLECRNVGRTFEGRGGSGKNEVLRGVNFEVHENEFLVLFGAGQCGKTTLLNILAGLDMPTEGEVYTRGQKVTGPAPERGVVYQKTSLFPWMTVEDNVGFGPEVRHMPKEERRARIKKYLELVGLTGFEKSYPSQLSGGMRQRVGIARAYANQPDIMLMDEPFGALDAQTRYSMEDEIIKIWEKNKRTIVFVTNNVEEALYLGDRIMLLASRPSYVKKEYIVDLPRPRSYTDKAFLEMRNEIVANTDLDI